PDALPIWPTDSQSTWPDDVTPLETYQGTTCPGDTLHAASEYSCNTAFAELAGDVGAEKLRATAEQFGIGDDELHIPMPVAESERGPLDNATSLDQSGIGQADVQLPPLQRS